MSKSLQLNLKVALFDSDFFALQSLNSYMAWDRRTRVTFSTNSLEQLFGYFQTTPDAELPDVLVMDADHIGGAEALTKTLRRLRGMIEPLVVICLAQSIERELIEASAEAGARAYLLKQDVQLQITWAIIYALDYEFLVTSSLRQECKQSFNSRIYNAQVLPPQREYPEMTERIRQAIKLCVIEGMPAHLAADEMGISLHTIRGYIKEGYRILEAYDHTQYPTDMTPQERAFMRFTALADDSALSS